MLPAETAAQILRPCLDANERLLWSGQPRGGIRLRPADAFVIPFSLAWGGFAIFWEVMAVTHTAKSNGPIGAIFPLFGLPFVCIGLYLIFGRFFADARFRTKTYYGVTNERIVIVTGLFSRQIKSMPIRSLGDLTLTERADGSGTITFGSSLFGRGFFPGGAWPGGSQYFPPAFDMIEQAKQVYKIIREAQKTPP